MEQPGPNDQQVGQNQSNNSQAEMREQLIEKHNQSGSAAEPKQKEAGGD